MGGREEGRRDEGMEGRKDGRTDGRRDGETEERRECKMMWRVNWNRRRRTQKEGGCKGSEGDQEANTKRNAKLFF